MGVASAGRTRLEWEFRFREWAGGPGDTELEKCGNAERMIRKAIAASPRLKSYEIEVFSQGSFRNVTNIPQESDVDVSVCCRDFFYYDLPTGAERADYGFGSGGSSYPYKDYKQDVVSTILDYFGRENVTVGNKAVRIHSNSYRVDADVVPNFEYRLYSAPGTYRKGIRFFADDGTQVTNWPKQHIDEGIAKNSNTSKRFKRIARILKSLQVEMLDEKIVAKRSPSFFLESLAYNVPDNNYGNSSLYSDVWNVIAHICNNTRVEDDASEWTEVNGIKYLFHSSQPWSKSDARSFAWTAYNYVGFSN